MFEYDDAIQNGTIAFQRGDFERAIIYFKKALDLSKKIDDKPNQANILNNLGLIYKYSRKYPEAEKYFEEALNLMKQLGNIQNVGTILHNIGLMYKEQGKLDKAMSNYEEALKIFKKFQLNTQIGGVLCGMGVIHQEKGNLKKARDIFEEAANIDDEKGKSIDLGYLGDVEQELGHYQEAINHYQDSIMLQRLTGNLPGVGYILKHLGDVYKKMMDNTKAANAYNQAYEIYLSISDYDEAEECSKLIKELEARSPK